MNKTEFEKQKQVLKDTYEKELDKLKTEYALSNNSVKIGDIISSSICIIKVEKILVAKQSYFSDLPECRYKGKKIKKDGKFFKDNSDDIIYQSDLKKINGVEVKNENI